MSILYTGVGEQIRHANRTRSKNDFRSALHICKKSPTYPQNTPHISAEKSPVYPQQNALHTNDDEQITHIASPPAPMHYLKIFKGLPTRDAPSELVQLLHKMFPPDHDGQVEMKTPTTLSNKTSTAWSGAEDTILENKFLKQDSKYLYWTTSKIYYYSIEYLYRVPVLL